MLCAIAGFLGCCFYGLGGIYGDGYDDVTISEAIWQSFCILLDTGIEFLVIETPNRVISGVITITGVLFAATLTGFVVDLVQSQLDGIRRGRQAVCEWNHTLLVGWTDRSIAFILQICLANASAGGGVIVVLTSEEKVETEKSFYLKVPKEKLFGTKVVFRSGSTQSVHALSQCNAAHARSIVILSLGQNPNKADANTLRILMALDVTRVNPDQNIVAEVRDPQMDHGKLPPTTATLGVVNY